jgi:hypothetical protein
MPDHGDDGDPKRRRKYNSRFDESKFNESELNESKFNQSRVLGDGQHQPGQRTCIRNGTDESLYDYVRHSMPACAGEYCAAFDVKRNAQEITIGRTRSITPARVFLGPDWWCLPL